MPIGMGHIFFLEHINLNVAHYLLKTSHTSTKNCNNRGSKSHNRKGVPTGIGVLILLRHGTQWVATLRRALIGRREPNRITKVTQTRTSMTSNKYLETEQDTGAILSLNSSEARLRQ